MEGTSMLKEIDMMKKVKAACNEQLSSPTMDIFKNSKTRPSWLQSTLDDMDRRMKMLVLSVPEGAPSGDTFKERAEYYYQKRPELLALLQDLYLGYLALSDKYIQTLAKQNRHGRQSSLVFSIDNDFQEDCRSTPVDSDAESSLSYQPHHLVYPPKSNIMDADSIIAELVIKNVELDILVDEVTVSEKRLNDSTRKIELQKSLLEVLESERLILLNENAKLCCQVATLMEENKELESESSFVKRKASEMARCLIKMREEQRVGTLNQKIDDLQGKIQGLEKKNKEYYDQLVNKENCDNLISNEYFGQIAVEEQQVKEGKGRKKKMKNGCEVNLQFLHHIHKLKLKRESSKKIKRENSNKKIPKWWAKVKNMDFFLCGSQPSSSK